ncbi:MAG: DUF58 domain-containing protein [Myxococcota bacterium]
MPFVPARPLFLALLAPLALGLVTVIEPAWTMWMVAMDVLILTAAALDLLLALPAGVAVRRKVPAHASLARAFAVELEVRSGLSRPVEVQINDAYPKTSHQEGLPGRLRLEPGTVRHLDYQVRPMRRGPAHFEQCWVRYPSPGGFWFRQLKLPLEDTVRIFPDVQAVRHWELLARTDRNRASRLTRLRGGDTEFERLRDHQRDDEFRRIDWRATARRRRLTVREYQLEQDQNLVVMLDCGRTMTGEWSGLTALDHALNASLMLTHVAVRRGDKVGLVAFGEEVLRFIEPRGGASASNHIIQATYDLFPQMVEPDYDSALRLFQKRVRQRTLVVIITHALDEPTAARLQTISRELLPRHLPLVVLLRDADIEERVRREAEDEETFAVQAAAVELLMWRDRVTLELERAGVLVLDVLHRDLTGALLARYLEVKARGLI